MLTWLQFLLIFSHLLQTGKTLKLEIQANSITALDTDTAPSMVPGLATVPAVNGKLESVATLDMKTNHAVNSKMSFDAQLSGSKLSSETGFQVLLVLYFFHTSHPYGEV